ncbi:MAG: zinc-ribbon domain-containing protein [Myxococcales bacterium]|nr:zinc-ribbon domain-containing protein [Myxococcales bacterium]
MKIICDSCSAKYSIADEKVPGKVFKIRCKKCSNMIIVRGDQLEAPSESTEHAPSSSGGATTTGSVSRADAFGADPAAAGGYDASTDPIWHVVVNGDQQGPYAPVQLGEMLTVGTIDWDAYVWREGFDGWVPARDVAELVEAITGQPYDASYSSSGEQGAPQNEHQDGEVFRGDAFGAQDAFGHHDAFAGIGDDDGTSVAASPFQAGGTHPEPAIRDAFPGDDYKAGVSDMPTAIATQEDLAAGGVSSPAGASASAVQFSGGMEPMPEEVASRASRDDAADLFAAQSDLGAGGLFGASPAPQAAAPSVPDQTSMTGQRNENSVLFSLSNLQALAGDTGDAGEAQPGHASGDASGLIDIRALASATGVGVGRTQNQDDRIDEIMSIGTGSPLAAGALGAPVLTPVRDDSSNKKLLLIAIGVGGLLVVGLVVALVLALTGKDEPIASTEPQPIVPGNGAPNAAPDPAAPGSGANSGTEDKGAAAAKSADQDDSAAKAEEEEDEDDDSPSGQSRARARAKRRSAPARSADPDPAPAPAPSKPSRSNDSIDDLLNGAIGTGGTKSSAAKAAAPDPSLPAKPSRNDVLSALRSVEGRVKACGKGEHGVAKTAVTVSGSTGRVTSAVVSGQFSGTPVGSCVAKAVRTAKFPKFRESSFSVNFPYSI